MDPDLAITAAYGGQVLVMAAVTVGILVRKRSARTDVDAAPGPRAPRPSLTDPSDDGRGHPS
jgi:hypothetical protein